MRAKTVYESINFQRYKDPKQALGLDPFEFNVEFNGDEAKANSDEHELARKWRFNGIKIIKVEGFYEDDGIGLEINLSNGDYIRFDSEFDIGPGSSTQRRYSSLREFAQISIGSELISRKNVLEKFMEYFENGSIILAVMKIYEDIIGKKIQESLSFKRYKDPKQALGMGLKALMLEIIQMFLEHPLSEYDWDFLTYNEEEAEAAFRIRFDEYPEDLDDGFSWKIIDVRESFDIQFLVIINLKKLLIKSILTADNSDIFEYKFKHSIENKIEDLDPLKLVTQVEKIWEKLWKEDKSSIAYEAYEYAEAIKYKDEKNLKDDLEYDPDENES